MPVEPRASGVEAEVSGAPAGPRSLGPIPGLDGLRGVAVLAVIGLHAGYTSRSDGTSWLPGGFIGVDLFFVLSGFLITALLLGEHGNRGRVSFRHFYLRRACRLLPALFAMLAFHLVYAVASHKDPKRELEALGSIALYVSNFTQAAHKFMPSELVHTWSLAVEEQFYFIWPAVLVGVLLWRARRHPGRWTRVIPALVPAGIVATMVIRIVMWRTHGFNAAYELPFCRSDSLLVGCGLAFLWKAGKLPRRWAPHLAWVALAGFVAFLVAWPTSSTATYYGVFTLIAVGFGLIINAVLIGDRAVNAIFTWRPLRAVGRVSYGAYLWHPVVLDLLLRHFAGRNTYMLTAVGLVLTAVVTVVSWKLVEQPFLRLKRRYETRPQAEAAAPTVLSTQPA